MKSANFPETPSPFKKSMILFHLCTMLFWGSVYIYMPILAPYTKLVSGSLQSVGLVMGAYGLSQFLFRIPIGLWSDRLRRRKPFILLGFLFDGLACLGLIFSSNTATLFFSFFTAGIAASMWVVFTVLFSSYFPLEQVFQSMSFILFSLRLSQVIANFAGGVVAEAWGWVAPFYVGAILSLAGLLLATGIAEHRPEKSGAASFKKLLLVGRNRLLLTVSVFATLLQFATFSTTYGFTPIYAQQIGASKEELGILLFSYMLPCILTTLLSGTYLWRIQQERSFILAGFFLVTGAVFSTPLVSRLGMLYAVQAANGIGVGLAFPLLMGLAIQPIPLEQQGTAMGFFQSLYAAGMSLGPVISGFMGDHLGLPSIFILSGILCLLPAFFSWKNIQIARR
jgi:DHA1 family multidrug resistance protein-like MFS transporter